MCSERGHYLNCNGPVHIGPLQLVWIGKDIPFPEAGGAAVVGLPLPLVVDFAGELVLWLSSELSKASLSLSTSTWAIHRHKLR